MMTPMVEVSEDGKTATGTFCLVCMVTMIDDALKMRYILVGKYSNKYVKIDGKWLFTELTGVIDQTAPWDKGWVKAAITKESWKQWPASILFCSALHIKRADAQEPPCHALNGYELCKPRPLRVRKAFRLHRARARGGVGLIMMEYATVDESGLSAPFQLGVFSDKHIPGMSVSRTLRTAMARSWDSSSSMAGCKLTTPPCQPMAPSAMGDARG